ncbi:hypothetical protein GCM10009574_005850 [Streptomyces asiaticus]|uniref:Uncharacterized protein n=2 Tax=Streptomyces rhizosphaericus TaxID=114699 RepID=A0ABP4D3X2_9ACTN
MLPSIEHKTQSPCGNVVLANPPYDVFWTTLENGHSLCVTHFWVDLQGYPQGNSSGQIGSTTIHRKAVVHRLGPLAPYVSPPYVNLLASKKTRAPEHLWRETGAPRAKETSVSNLALCALPLYRERRALRTVAQGTDSGNWMIIVGVVVACVINGETISAVLDQGTRAITAVVILILVRATLRNDEGVLLSHHVRQGVVGSIGR